MLVYTKKDAFMRLLCNILLCYYTLYFTNNLENGLHDTFLSRNKFGKMKQHHVKLLPPPPNLSVKVEVLTV